MYYISYIILIISLSILIILNIISIKRKNKVIKKLESVKTEELKDVFKERWDKEEKDFKLKKTELQIKEKEIEGEIAQLKTSLKEKEKRYNEVNQDLDLYKEGKIKEIDSAAAEYEQRKQLEIKQLLQQKEFQANSDFNNHVDSYIIQKAQMQSEIKEIKAELEVERGKRAAINEEILRQRRLEEEQDFYRIQLDSTDKDDVEFLRRIAPRLRHPEAINKVIWSGYYQKPLAELRKRLLPNGDKSGIYKITRMKTKELYIGQTTSFDRRFQDHVKTALGVGTLANSQFHKAMSKDGPENFFFEILEEVEKDRLREREAYYIQWFKSDKFGLNTISGDKNK